MDKESSEGDNRGDSIIGDSSSLFEEEHTEPLRGSSSLGAGTATAKKPREVLGARRGSRDITGKGRHG